MTNKKEFIERRKHERFKVKSGAIAMIRPLPTKQYKTKDISMDGNSLATAVQYCQIIYINKDGLSLRYIGKNGESNEPIELDLLFMQNSICFTYLKNLPVKTVRISKSDSKSSSGHIKTIQRAVQFGGMTPSQESQLDRFIKKYTIM